MSDFAATGLSYGPTPDPQHARIAVTRALSRSGRHSASGVILFLSSGYIEPSSAIVAASRAAGCLAVAGCHGDSLITEDEWLVDTEGAVALVVHDPVQLSHLSNPPGTSIDFCSPQSISAAWLDAPARRFGAVASAMSSNHPNQVWASGRCRNNGHAEVFVHGCRNAVGICHGIQPLTPPVTVQKTDGFAVLEIGKYPALNVLSQAIPNRYRHTSNSAIATEMLMGGVVFGDPSTAIASGRYHLNQVVAADQHNRSITFSDKLRPGEQVFLAISDRLAAQREMSQLLPRLQRSLNAPPQFGLYLPCVSRQPSVDCLTDPSLEALRQCYADLPIIGFYGHGQITPLEMGSHLHFHCAGVGLFSV